MRYRMLMVGLCVLLLAGMLPGLAAAQSSYAITVRLWYGEAPRVGRYVIGQSTGVTLYYFWYAATDDQLQDFIEHATLNIFMDGEPLFESAQAAAMWWQPSEPFSLDGRSVRRAKWLFTLEQLPIGAHTFEAVITLDAAVSDGVSSAMFGPGELTHTVNVVTVVGPGCTLPSGLVSPAALPSAWQTGQGSTVLPTVAPTVPAAVAAAPTVAPVVLPPTVAPVIPTATPAPPAEAPRDQWVPRSATYAGRVVGTFTAESPAFWGPAEGKLVDPPIVFQPGQTLWVYGLDPTRQFYMVILDEAYIWVRAWTIGPTNDATWMGKPLPGVIIDPNS